jgi:lysophospholipase L1-like esterase
MRGRLAAVGAALVGVFMSPVAPAQAAAARYVALGDSYSSGTGTRTYIDDGTTCQRSVYAYPSLLASARGYALNFRACSGATISDVTRLQLSALSRRTAYVTISVGGNDAGFSHVLSTCAQPRWAADCHDATARGSTSPAPSLARCAGSTGRSGRERRRPRSSQSVIPTSSTAPTATR